LDIWHSKLAKSDFKDLANIIKEAKEQREKEELNQIPEEDIEPKTEKKSNIKKVDQNAKDITAKQEVLKEDENDENEGKEEPEEEESEE